MEGTEVIKRLSKEPCTATELARLFKKHHYTMERYMEGLKARDRRLRTKTIGRATVYWVAEEPFEEYIEFIKEMAGELEPRDTIFLRLLESRAFSPETSVSVGMLKDRKEHLDELITSGRIVLTSKGKIYLTELGRKIAEGMALIYEKSESV
jgi:hypothetical protein